MIWIVFFGGTYEQIWADTVGDGVLVRREVDRKKKTTADKIKGAFGKLKKHKGKALIAGTALYAGNKVREALKKRKEKKKKEK